MTDKKRPSIDGFIPRRGINNQTGTQGGLQSSYEHSGLSHASNERDLKGSALKTEDEGGLVRADIDESLRSIDSTGVAPESDGSRRRDRKKDKKTPSGRRKKTKRIILIVLALLAVIGIVFGVIFIVKALKASNSVFKGDIFGIIQSKELKADKNGRSNILIFGTSEDHFEGGKQHDGAFLTDSIMVLSIDQKKNNAFMFSIPRDFYVKFPAGCTAGSEGKINEVYGCTSNSGKNEEAGAKAFQAKVGEITGLEMQYYAHVNYTVMKEAVDAVGGVSVKIESEDPRGILDRNFDWQCNYKCYYVKYPNGQTGNLNGEHALALARARNASGGYGLSGGNFDREKYQQKILKALQQKALSAGTLADFGKVTKLVDTFGNNLRTNFDTSEIRTLIRLGQEVKQENIKSISLVDADPQIVGTGMVRGMSVVKPTAGLFSYAAIQAYIMKKSNDSPASAEDAKIGVYNGSGVPGKAQVVADAIAAKGLTISGVGNAKDGTYAAYEIYDITNTKPETRKMLESLYGVQAVQKTPPVAVTGLDFVVIVGK